MNIRNLKYSLLAATALFVTSCSTQKPQVNSKGKSTKTQVTKPVPPKTPTAPVAAGNSRYYQFLYYPETSGKEPQYR